MAKGDFTKEKQITKETKQKVWERQKGRSIFAPHLPITVEECCCHFVSKGQSGVGYEWNIFGCFQRYGIDEHKLFDQHKPIGNLTSDEVIQVIENHFKRNYIGWSKKKCHYIKGNKEKDYGIERIQR